jgi:hypothetical protein
MLAEHLARAARDVAAGERHVERQRRIVGHLKLEGRDVRELRTCCSNSRKCRPCT